MQLDLCWEHNTTREMNLEMLAHCRLAGELALATLDASRCEEFGLQHEIQYIVNYGI